MKRALVLSFFLLAAGCGGPGKTMNPADLVPAATTEVTVVRTAQAAQARRLAVELNAVPVPSVPAGSGPLLVVARLDEGVVYFTQPADVKTFVAAHPLHAKVRGWIAFGSSRAALDAVRHRKRTLAGLALLPPRAAVRVWEPGQFSSALTIDGRTATLEWHSRAVRAVPQVSTLVGEVPADALAAGGGSLLPSAVVAAVGPESVGWVRGGLPFPELTVVSTRGTVRGAAPVLARLTKSTAPATPYGAFRRLALGAIDIYYGRRNGQLVVTDDANALASPAHRLSLASLPPRVEGWMYADVEHGMPVADAFRGFANWKPPAGLDRLRPFTSFFTYTRHAGGIRTTVTTVEMP
jgi:hypothetical protein